MNPGRAEERGDHIVFKRKKSQFFTGNESALQQECIWKKAKHIWVTKDRNKTEESPENISVRYLKDCLGVFGGKMWGKTKNAFNQAPYTTDKLISTKIGYKKNSNECY